ncbi:hypothetical protein NESM_000096400 [Novymonas esmeraldas]|uniref:DUF1308 domain-containing protein n=1 Tax=Novymonas esmeraldas TaxID=1808958 RepID=A0AAW0F448_9TRYP
MDQLYEAAPIPVSDDEDGDGRVDEGSGLDVSAHSSGASSRSTSSADTTRADRAEADDDASRDADPHRHAFTTASSPSALYTFLLQLQRTAEELHTRLERVQAAESSPVASPCPTAAASRDERPGASCRTAGYQGAAKLRSRLRTELENIRRAVEGLGAAGCAGAVDSLDLPPAILEAAVACAQCNSMAHFDAVLTCLEREPHVTGVYVPVGGHSAKDARVDVDVVSCGGRRWIKVKTTTSRSLAIEAAVLAMNGTTAFTDALLALVARSKETFPPHRHAVQVAVVLLHPPPPALATFLATHGIAWASLAARRSAAAPPLATHCPQPPAAAAVAAGEWLPPLSPAPTLVCLDTTALVALCSQSCYVDGLSRETRIERLAPFHVLQMQQRKEVEECHAIVEVIEPALRSHTTWHTAEELEQLLRHSLLRECTTGDVAPATAAVAAAAGSSSSSTSHHRSSHLPPRLITPASLDWLGPLGRSASARIVDASGAASHPSVGVEAVDESRLLVECDEQMTAAAAATAPSVAPALLRPNWIVADVSYEEFKWVLETIAGPQEVARASRLLRLVCVVDTSFLREHMGGAGARGPSAAAATASATVTPPPPSPPLFTSVERLVLSGKVSLRNKLVFGLADAVDAVVVTANEQLCHAAREQGVHVEVCLHPSRSLTEQKMHGLRRRHGPRGPPPVVVPPA